MEANEGAHARSINYCQWKYPILPRPKLARRLSLSKATASPMSLLHHSLLSILCSFQVILSGVAPQRGYRRVRDCPLRDLATSVAIERTRESPSKQEPSLREHGMRATTNGQECKKTSVPIALVVPPVDHQLQRFHIIAGPRYLHLVFGDDNADVRCIS